VFSCSITFLVRDFADRDFVDFALDLAAELFFGFADKVASGLLVFGNKRSLRIVAVAGVHVEVERTAARIESAVACKEAIYNTEQCSVIED